MLDLNTEITDESLKVFADILKLKLLLNTLHVLITRLNHLILTFSLQVVVILLCPQPLLKVTDFHKIRVTVFNFSLDNLLPKSIEFSN